MEQDGLVEEDKKLVDEAKELSAPQTIEAYREARAASRISDKRLYQIQVALDASRRSNGILVEELHKLRAEKAEIESQLEALIAGMKAHKSNTQKKGKKKSHA